MFLSVTLLTLALQLPLASNQQDIDRFQVAEVKERRAIMLLMARKRDAQAQDVLPFVEWGLVDPDPDVRRYATASLSNVIAMAARGTSAAQALRARPRLPALLVGALEDSEYMVRVGAVPALEATGALRNDRFLSALVEHYDRETDDRVRHVIIDTLRPYMSATAMAGDVALKGLRDSSAQVRRRAAVAVAAFRPEAALPLLMRELESGTNDTRRDVLYAIGSYGSAARAFVPALQRLLAAENDPARRGDLERTLSAIR
jgi:HEAT repeat protein